MARAKRKASAVKSDDGKQKGKQAKLESADSVVTSGDGMKWIHGGGEQKPGVPMMHVRTNPDKKDRNDSKLAAFDIDWCVVKPKSGGTWPKGPNDWCWLLEGDVIPNKIRDLHKEGYRILFISNQSGFEKKSVKVSDITIKCDQVISALGIPVEVILVSGQSIYRKPDVGTWDYFVNEWNSGVEFDRNQSFFVGDAAGRPEREGSKRKADFSCSDRMFAANLGIKFYTPEELFLNVPTEKFSWGAKSIDQMLKEAAGNGHDPKGYHSATQELIIMCGPPASGKSTFSETFLVPFGYVRVNRDTLKTPAKCLKVAQESLNAGKSVVVDNTNPSPSDRAPYIAMAKKKGVPVRCFQLLTDWDLAVHLNLFRQSLTKGEVRRVPAVAYNVYKGKISQPCTSEGFAEVKIIPFVLDESKFSDKEKKLLRNWTTLGH